MKSYQGLMMNALILLLITSCSNLRQSQPFSQNTIQESEERKLVHISDKVSDSSPTIPFSPHDAFYPMAKDGSGVEYKWRECAKRFIVCLKWEQKKVVFKFTDKNIMEWFIANDFGLKKREKP